MAGYQWPGFDKSFPPHSVAIYGGTGGILIQNITFHASYSGAKLLTLTSCVGGGNGVSGRV